jgi:hypothetical protein
MSRHRRRIPMIAKFAEQGVTELSPEVNQDTTSSVCHSDEHLTSNGLSFNDMIEPATITCTTDTR